MAALDADYDYDGLQTCAADGMCQSACPVLIDTGALVRRLRAESTGRLEEKAWTAAAGHWSGLSAAGSVALTLAAKAPGAAERTSAVARGQDGGARP